MLVLRQSMGPLTGGTGEKADYMLAELLECSERFSVCLNVCPSIDDKQESY